MKRLFVLVFALITFQGFSQEDHLVLNNGDTIFGKINFRTPETYKEVVTIKNDDGSRDINSNKIVQVSVKGDSYRSIRYGEKYRIMKIEISGYVSLLRYRDDQDYEFSAAYMHKIGGEGIAVSSIGFRKKVVGFLNDCSDLATAVENKEYSYKQLDAIVNAYNETCVRQIKEEIAVKNQDFGDLKELQAMLSEVLTKLEKGETIPDYLKNVLVDYTQKDINEALKRLLMEVSK